jgi:hypothetical protein
MAFDEVRFLVDISRGSSGAAASFHQSQSQIASVITRAVSRGQRNL